MRRKFAKQYGFVVPEIRLADDLAIPPKTYEIRIHGTVTATAELRLGDVPSSSATGRARTCPARRRANPLSGVTALDAMFCEPPARDGFPRRPASVLLTRLASPTIRNTLARSYKDLRLLLDRLDPEYRRLLEEIVPSQISHSGLQAVLKLLLAERISIRNLHLILEAIAEIVPFVRKADQIAEHVRIRLAQQICGDPSDHGVLKVLRLGNRWDLAFHQALKRDAKGEVVEFDIDPRLIEQFGAELATSVRRLMDEGHQFVLVAAAEARLYLRLVSERLFATLPVLSHLEIARGAQIQALGSVS